MEVIKLNLIPGKACPVVHASQFDDGRDFKAELYEGVNVYTLDGTETLTAIVKKPDGNEVTAAVTNTSDDYVIITTTEQMTACAGGNLGTLRIEKGAVTIATLNFILECQASPDTGIQSDSEIHNLEAQVNQMVEDAVAEQYDSNNVLFDTAPTAGHGVPYAVTSGGLWSWLRDLPLRAYPTASGSIATFDTSLALPLQDCTIAINAVQESGTPTPSSPKLISGFTGANIYDKGVNFWDEEWEIGAYDLSTGQKTNANNRIRTKNYIAVLPSTTYFNCCPDIIIALFYDRNKTFLSQYGFNANSSFVTPPKAYYMNFHVATAYGTTYNHDISINYPATDTAYHAYDGHTTPITWQTEAGTVYGGLLDVTSGVLMVTHQVIDMGSLTWNTVGMGGGRTGFKSTISDIELAPAATVVFNGKCECYASLNGNDVYLGNTGVATWGANTHDIAVYDPDRESLSGADFKTAVTGSDLVYTLQTPVTYQLTPTQISAIVGTNNVFTDTNGNTSVVFACSLKDYIDGQ